MKKMINSVPIVVFSFFCFFSQANATSKLITLNLDTTDSVESFVSVNAKILQGPINKGDVVTDYFDSDTDQGWPRFVISKDAVHRKVQLVNQNSDIINAELYISRLFFPNYFLLPYKMIGTNCTNTFGTEGWDGTSQTRTQRYWYPIGGVSKERVECIVDYSAAVNFGESKLSEELMSSLSYFLLTLDITEEPIERVKAGVYTLLEPETYTVCGTLNACDLSINAGGAFPATVTNPIITIQVEATMPVVTTFTTDKFIKLDDAKSSYLMTGQYPEILEAEADFQYESNSNNTWSLTCEYSSADSCATKSDSGDLLPFDIVIDLPQTHITDSGQTQDIKFKPNHDLVVLANKSSSGIDYRGRGEIKMSTLAGESERVYKDHSGTSYQGKVTITIDAIVK
ncbi:hypothetical protein [Shewanella japonica]|uniref:Uncharacterized protein n=1 Tax=Shewanella japonica TaxID=93973 RepID=A0ABN4YDF3_9GAMM|nr:hypothetical protein [Shewanella japonica]ARD22476.1 hypothetical protein SJ2017_2181 [Shewanella japonica]